MFRFIGIDTYTCSVSVRKNSYRFNETSLQDVYPRIKSWLQSMVYRRPFVIKMHVQSQYTYTFMLKVRTHVQFDSASQTRTRSKTGGFLLRTNEHQIAELPVYVKKCGLRPENTSFQGLFERLKKAWKKSVFSISLSKNYAFRLKGLSEHYVLAK